MRLEKYILIYADANAHAAKKTGITPLFGMHLKIMVLLRLWGEMNRASIRMRLKKYDKSVIDITIWSAAGTLVKRGVIERTRRGTYMITPLGREYLSHIRQYLFNKRIN